MPSIDGKPTQGAKEFNCCGKNWEITSYNGMVSGKPFSETEQESLQNPFKTIPDLKSWPFFQVHNRRGQPQH